jgi:adenine/guanine phosphoribosyltransferase-like PRPP-binding protein
LVDDVLTTGRTAAIASGLLGRAGAARVTLAVVAVRDVVGADFVEKVEAWRAPVG